MKKSLLTFACAVVLGATGLAFAPVRDDRKPIIAEKLAFAEEVVEYDSQIEQENEQRTFVCVEGKSQVSISPDIAKIYGMIEVVGNDLVECKNTGMERLDGVFSALKKGGIDEGGLYLQNFRCTPTYDFSNGKSLIGYATSASFCVQVDDIGKVQKYVDIMTENGVTSVCDICYEVSNMEEEYATALSQAFENAREKATALLGSEVRLVRIAEEHTFSPYSLCRSCDALSGEYVGKIEITARVKAVFEVR